MESPVYNNGVILKVTNTHDPYVSRSGLNIDNTKYNGIEVKMKVDGAAQVAEVYYFTADKGNFNAEQRLSSGKNDEVPYIRFGFGGSRRIQRSFEGNTF